MQNLTPMQQMIYSGQFGAYSPTQGYGNQYVNQQPMYSNMVPMGNTYQQPMNNYVYQPIGGYQQQPQYQYHQPQPQNQYYQVQQQPQYYQSQQPKYDYYNPYGGGVYQQPQPQYYNYGYQQQQPQYNGYNNYRPFVSPLARERQLQEEVELTKMKIRMVNQFNHVTMTEEELDQMVNPRNKVNVPSEEEIRNAEETRFFQYVSHLSELPQTYGYTYQLAQTIRTMSAKKHEMYDDHSLCQFIMDDLWKIERDDWIDKNIDKNQSRNLSSVYNSNDYNELLRLHRGSSSTPSMDEILNSSSYDNNFKDLEVGMGLAADRAQRRKLLLEGKVPEFISSDETQRRRAEWTKQVIAQMYAKNGGAPPNV